MAQELINGKYKSFHAFYGRLADNSGTQRRIAESSEPPTAVVPLPPALNSRPGPACGSGERGFQNVSHGKYTSVSSACTTDPHYASRSQSTTVKNYLTVYYQNVRGLRTKTNELRLLLSSCDYDVLVFTETWLRPDIIDSELSSDYSLFRCDRSERTSELSRGGGVLIAIKNNITSTLISLPNSSHLEQVAVRVHLPSRSLYICCIYLRPNSNADVYAAHSAAIGAMSDQVDTTDVIMVLGDYNLPHLRWQCDADLNGYLPSNASSEQEIVLTETLLACGLVQLNNLTNVNGRWLDLLFSNMPDEVEVDEPPHPLLPVDCHHRPFVVLLDARCDVLKAADRPAEVELNFRRCDFDVLNNALASIDWQQHLVNESVDLDMSTFYDKLFEVLVDSRTSPLKEHASENEKSVFKSKTQENRRVLRNMEATYKNLLADTHRAYLQNVQQNLRQNPASFWKYVKSLKAGPRIPSSLQHASKTSSTADEAVELFSDFFQSVYSTSSPAIRPECFQSVNSYDISLPEIRFSIGEVRKALEMSTPQKALERTGFRLYFSKIAQHHWLILFHAS
ncbi:uncharacterized protein LOC129720266 [Wyeomyia smithii]|uniref:uncharacterized protein LOC129720266 n=1 Tax=Wyeomyia smithii TaxID=174621 RepID=UPI00246805D0|nr:uncharacterized protein LOC129720266 [Wyeomyia smithii]